MESFLTVVATLVSALIANSIANSMAEKRLEKERAHNQQVREEDAKREEALRAELREEDRARRIELQQREDVLRKQDYKRLTNSLELEAVISFVDLCYQVRVTHAQHKTENILDSDPDLEAQLPISKAEIKTFTYVIQQMERIVTRCYLLSIQISNSVVHKKVAQVHKVLAEANVSGFSRESDDLAAYIKRNNELPLPLGFENLLMELATIAKFQYQEFDDYEQESNRQI